MINKNYKFFICAAGIFASYFYFGILQEKITRSKYEYQITEDGITTTITEHFRYFLVLVFVQCFVSCCFAKALLTIWPHGEDTTRNVYYACGALTYLLAMVFSNMVLQWLPYPTQVSKCYGWGLFNTWICYQPTLYRVLISLVLSTFYQQCGCYLILHCCSKVLQAVI